MGKKPYLITFILGMFSLASYIILLINESWVTEHYTKGGFYVIYPIFTALWFSFVHGSFTSNLIKILGIEERNKPK